MTRHAMGSAGTRNTIHGVLVLALTLTGGCYDSFQREGVARPIPVDDAGTRPGPGPGPRPDAGDRPPPPPPPPLGRTRDVDLLFVVDTSVSMTEEQVNLARELPRMIDILATGDFNQDGDTDDDTDFRPVRELHVGVVSMDMGAGGHPIPTCTEPVSGDDGRLRPASTMHAGFCDPSWPAFLSFDAERTDEDIAEVNRRAGCYVAQGTAGCGIEQPLEAMLKALSPAARADWTAPFYAPPVFADGTSGRGSTAHRGFADRDSVLAVVLFTDEDDCSIADPDLYEPSGGAYPGDLNLRCFLHRDAALHPLSRFVDGLLALRRAPSRVVVSAIVGIPESLAGTNDWDLLTGPPGVRDPSLEERIDAANPNRLAPTCNTSNGLAFPPTRILEFAHRIDAGGGRAVVQSICGDGFRNALNPIIDRIGG